MFGSALHQLSNIAKIGRQNYNAFPQDYLS